ncbi:MAG TPA: hypothetical protein VMA09_00255 [Candidatus Binataceae bacterium]|nr:hypothetical protein [Candidatus Binataceae bacterium]
MAKATKAKKKPMSTKAMKKTKGGLAAASMQAAIKRPVVKAL